MGSRVSSDNKNNVEDNKNNYNNNVNANNDTLNINKNTNTVKKNETTLSYFMKDSSSYQGLKSDYSTNSDKLIKEKNERDHNDNEVHVSKGEIINIEKKEVLSPEIKIPTNFIWREGGNVVYITGSFSNWGQWFLMSKVPNTNEFKLTLVN
jgi:hypothetical protein